MHAVNISVKWSHGPYSEIYGDKGDKTMENIPFFCI